MTIQQAINEARKTGEWSVVIHMPSSINIGFVNGDGREDETQFDIFGDNPEKELEDLWKDLHMELDGDIDSITYVSYLGYVEN